MTVVSFPFFLYPLHFLFRADMPLFLLHNPYLRSIGVLPPSLFLQFLQNSRTQMSQVSRCSAYSRRDLGLLIPMLSTQLSLSPSFLSQSRVPLRVNPLHKTLFHFFTTACSWKIEKTNWQLNIKTFQLCVTHAAEAITLECFEIFNCSCLYRRICFLYTTELNNSVEDYNSSRVCVVCCLSSILYPRQF